MSRDQNAGTES